MQVTDETPIEAAPQITVDATTHGGVPCVGNWPISHILDELAAGTSVESLLHTHTGLALSDVLLALEAAAWVMRDPSIDWSVLDLPAMIAFQRESRGWQSLSDVALNLAGT